MWTSKGIRRFPENEKKTPSPLNIQICSTETLSYSPMYVTAFISWSTDTWLLFCWCLLLACFCCNEHFESVKLCVFYLCVLGSCPYMYTKEDDCRKGIAALDGCYIEELCSHISYLGRICTYVLCTFADVGFCHFTFDWHMWSAVACKCFLCSPILAWSVMFWINKSFCRKKPLGACLARRHNPEAKAMWYAKGPPPPTPPPPPRPPAAVATRGVTTCYPRESSQGWCKSGD